MDREPKYKKQDLFPLLYGAERQVLPGEYRMLGGSDEPKRFRQIALVAGRDFLPGVQRMGSVLVYGQRIDLLSFLYHKQDANGKLETEQRVIAFTGVGYGEHPGHTGQEPTWYLVGPQVGTLDPEAGVFNPAVEVGAGTEISAKHFSISCIADGPFGDPVLANAQ